MGAVYTQLSLRKRRRIEDWWHAKVPVREMARVLKRSKSTIHREIKRIFWVDEAFPKRYAGYFGHAAQLQTIERRSVQRKLVRHPDLCKTVIAQSKQGWTPEQFENRMIHEGAKLRVCQETIYRYIYLKKTWIRNSGGTCSSIAKPAGRVVPESARSQTFILMSAFCSVRMMSHTVASSGIGG